MDYEYVALSYCTQQPHWDEGFVANRTQLLKEGWQGFVRASWRFPKLKGLGGACIMRRPKDEPQEKLEPIYEYVAVLDEDEAKGQWDALEKRGWAQVRCVRLSGPRGHIHLMRRVDQTVPTAEVESKDEPRKWTKAELEKVFRGVVLEVYGADAISEGE